MSDLSTAITDVLAAHQITTGMQVASGATCRCGAWSGAEPREYPVGMSWLVWHQAEMLAPVLEQVRAEERVKTLEWAADNISVEFGHGHSSDMEGVATVVAEEWLRAEARK